MGAAMKATKRMMPGASIAYGTSTLDLKVPRPRRTGGVLLLVATGASDTVTSCPHSTETWGDGTGRRPAGRRPWVLRVVLRVRWGTLFDRGTALLHVGGGDLLHLLDGGQEGGLRLGIRCLGELVVVGAVSHVDVR